MTASADRLVTDCTTRGSILRGGVTGVAATVGETALVDGDERGEGVAFGDGRAFGDGETIAMLGKAVTPIEDEGETVTDGEGGDCRLINGRLMRGIKPKTGTNSQGRCFSQLTIACLLIELNLPLSSLKI